MTMDFFDELRDKFRGLVNPSPAAFQVGRDQITIGLLGPDVRPVAEYLRSAYASRLVTVFAEDRVSTEGVFYNYYVFEQPGEPCYLILQAQIDAHQPRFPSLAAALSAVQQGVQILRVHDVAETRQALAIWRAIAAS
jgi:Ni,Fe-hydrogenase III component G